MERISLQNTPEGLYAGLYKMGAYLENAGLDKQLLLLVEYHVSLINKCAFCLDMHFKEALEAGVSTVKLSMVSAWRDGDLFNELERTVLKYAEVVTVVSDNDIDDDIYQQMCNHFSEAQIAAWTLAIVRINGWNRFMKAFKVKAGEYQVGQFA